MSAAKKIDYKQFVEDVREMREEGLSFRQIGERMGCCGATICNRLKQAGLSGADLPVKNDTSHPLTDVPDEELFGMIYEERAQGKTWPMVGLALGVTAWEIKATIAVRGWRTADFPGRHVGVDGKYIGAKKQGRAMGKGTICWDCANAVPNPEVGTGCSWSMYCSFIPVEGWTAEGNLILHHCEGNQQSYTVKACPQFIKG